MWRHSAKISCLSDKRFRELCRHCWVPSSLTSDMRVSDLFFLVVYLLAQRNVCMKNHATVCPSYRMYQRNWPPAQKYAINKKSTIYTLPKWPTHELIILTKSHKNWVKIVDFLLIAYFWAGGQFHWYILYLSNKTDRILCWDYYKFINLFRDS